MLAYPAAVRAAHSEHENREQRFIAAGSCQCGYVNFLVANGAVAVAWRGEIVKRRRHHSENVGRDFRLRCGQTGMAIETDQANFLADQHLRVAEP